MIPRRIFSAVFAAGAMLLTGAGAQADPGPTLAATLKRGGLACGVSEGAGFARRGAGGEWSGFDIDFCRAVAAAIFDDPGKARITVFSTKERASALQSNVVDLIAGGSAWTQARDTGRQIIYAGVSLHDGQGFLTHKPRAATSAQDLAGSAICVEQGTTHELDLVDYFHSREASYAPKLFASYGSAVKAYVEGACDALSADVTTLFATRAELAAPDEHVVLPDMISKSPRGPYVRQGDDQWLSIVRWTLFVMLNAEELGVAKANADQALKSENPQIRRLLGVDGDHGADLGLSGDWAYRIIKHVGNYADVFERNLGKGGPLGMERRGNGLWNKGGLMFAPPVR